MGTVAIKDGIIAADTSNYPYSHNGFGLRIAKIRYQNNNPESENPRYEIIACTGDYHQCKAFIEWFASGSEVDFAKKIDSNQVNFSAIVYSSEFDTYNMYINSTVPVPVDSICSIGTGRSYALGAMHYVASAEEAIFIASALDPFTNNKIQRIDLTNPSAEIEIINVN